MKITNVERYEIPFTSREASLNWDGGTTVAELIVALGKLPAEAKVATDYNRSGLLVAHFKPDIET
ncbi:hypothetical protein PBI_EQUEMIOH13_46 [Mycobacterium phage Equemioh13]|uniref:Uncharacterized protein n=1 Tax=Mycobacterium phage Centaur TaxID=2488784 RepID=A0A3G8FHX1_9CAUD|nr:hypothetical protein AVT12_gp60 [Mycobacterium phage Equemioh13]YP_010063661.1 hypothetical protein KIY82_gp61 [Mycobacterium phage Centaur]AMB18535.1 hypothetical protein NASIATALIE_45 [Mycobacterium phage NaSiaTalie]ATN92241.1 hypothetical protein SEA_UPDAWG_46 [Mycobacterium phage Updawg]AYD86320.1 hypothetical protein SEA_FLARE16_45 [Mycobacterium phage Flare16]QDM57247.1 hypothetical protein SEA_WIDEWALE_46 [Mycobacterium phage WideWale]QXN74074.1 hypothetical protein SEA_MICULUCIGAS_